MVNSEIVWYIIASLGAGIGTGLAGLSAATVMVPILIVLCPSFSGETGAYQATAIALASDILGSAVTAATYIRNKNIDLKRGWVMMVCILAMCTVGSWAAFKAGNVVLGGFTLFLTFFIGIRFLVKPDTTRKDAPSKGSELDTKGILISIFFGLTIGFGTGFVGTGGGMMMLVVFTVFLGMELKTAVGTSTFIMTFTALIASISHILIHPAVVLEKWPVLLICVVTTTAASLVSARFANRVSNRTVGLVTGVVLTILGAAMIFLKYREFFMNDPLIRGTLLTLWRYLLYIVPLALTLLLIFKLFRLPKDIFRKLLHIAAFTSSIYIVLYGEGWLAESLTLVIFGLLVYPLLSLAERLKNYSRFFVEKQPGEVKRSLLLLFFSQAFFVAVTCGLMKKPYILITAVAAWGLGDTAAAWVGRPLGRHKINIRFADHNKSWEGSAAMMVVSFAASLAVLLLMNVYAPLTAVLASLLVACTSAYAEMISKNGLDTVTVPAANILVLWLFSLIS